MRKKVLVAVITIVLLFSIVSQNLFAVSRTEAPKKEKLVFGVSLPLLAFSYEIPLLYGIRLEAEKLGIELIELEAGGFGNLDKQIAQVENLLQQNIDALILSATDGAGVVGVVEQAVSMGVPVVGVGSQANTDKVVTKVVADVYEMGVIEAEALAAAISFKGDVVMMSGPPGNNWTEDRADGFRDTVRKKYPEIRIVAEQ